MPVLRRMMILVAAFALAGCASQSTVSKVDPTTHEQLMGWVQQFFAHNYKDITERQTLEWGEPVVLPGGDLSIRYKFLAQIHGGERIIGNQVFTYRPDGTFVSVRDVEGFPQRPEATE